MSAKTIRLIDAQIRKTEKILDALEDAAETCPEIRAKSEARETELNQQLEALQAELDELDEKTEQKIEKLIEKIDGEVTSFDDVDLTEELDAYEWDPPLPEIEAPSETVIGEDDLASVIGAFEKYLTDLNRLRKAVAE